MFFDLSIPYLETLSTTDSSKSKTLKLHRLKTLARAMELGYTAVAYDRPFKGVISDADRCRILRFSLPSLLEVAPALPSAVALHRDRNGVPRSVPFRQFTRVTIAVDRMSVGSAFNGKGVLRSYDLVAAKPLDQDAFDRVCQVAEVDIIALDFPLKFRLKLPMVESAIKRGVYFEIKYSYLSADVTIRRQMLSDARLLVNWTRGKNLIISSSATNVNDIRGPYDVANLLSFLLGLSKERAKAAISGNCRSLIANALRKKDYKEAIRMERISSDEQLNSESNWFSDWKEWDPISTGEGDLPPLDDVSKLFSAVSKLPKSPAIDFLSSANKFSLKDHITSAGKDMLLVGEKAAAISCPKKPGSDTATAVSSSTFAVPVDDRKPVAVTPLGLKISSYEGDKILPSYTSRVIVDSEAVAITVSNYEILENSIPNNVALDAPGTLSSDIPLKHCTVTDLKHSERSDVVSVAMEAPRTVIQLVDNISSAADGHLSSNVSETCSTRSLGKVTPEEQVNAKTAEREHKDDILSDSAPLMMDSVEPAPSEEREALFPDDMPFEDGFSEMKVQEKEVLIACTGEVLVKCEDHNQLGSIAADGCTSYRLKSGKGRRKGRSNPAYPLPFKALLKKPMLFKKKSCQSRRLSRHWFLYWHSRTLTGEEQIPFVWSIKQIIGKGLVDDVEVCKACVSSSPHPALIVERF